MKTMKAPTACVLVVLCLLASSCKISGPGGIFGKASPHEKYRQMLLNAGLENTALGREWVAAAEKSLLNPLKVTIPYKETGYFPADQARASAISFEARQGQKVFISFQRQPVKDFSVYVDLWEERNSSNKKLLAYADTGASGFEHEIEKSGRYILRVQSELLRSGQYELSITTGPSLAFPVRDGKAQSFWGAARDAGARKHEGVDIFAPIRTPAIAAAKGTVTRVTTNKLGGKVVFLRPEGKDYNLYYAHLDDQLVSDGRQVNAGDTIGLVGTTGNARGGSPHLHFGIYTSSGAVDPYPFINKDSRKPAEVKVSASNMGRSMRSANNAMLITDLQLQSSGGIKVAGGSLVEIIGGTASWYKVLQPDGSMGFIKGSVLKPATSPLRELKIAGDRPLLDRPDLTAPRKTVLKQGETVKVLGTSGSFLFVEGESYSGWITSS